MSIKFCTVHNRTVTMNLCLVLPWNQRSWSKPVHRYAIQSRTHYTHVIGLTLRWHECDQYTTLSPWQPSVSWWQRWDQTMVRSRWHCRPARLWLTSIMSHRHRELYKGLWQGQRSRWERFVVRLPIQQPTASLVWWRLECCKYYHNSDTYNSNTTTPIYYTIQQ